MTTGECRGRPFASIVGTLYQLIEDTLIPTRTCQCLLVGGEVVVHVGEDAVSDIVDTCCQVIELRTSDRYEDENHIVDKEGSGNDE